MRIMAIDYGDAHTGVAISDLTGLLAGYTATIHTRRQEEVLARLEELIREYGVEELVLGYPKNMDGTLGPRAEKAAALEPGNADYQNLVYQFENGGTWYSRRQAAYGYPSMGGGNICLKLCIANLICNLCCGGGGMCCGGRGYYY